MSEHPPTTAEPVAIDRVDLAHLGENRRLVIRRSLLATTVGGLIPLPVMDDYVASRILAGLLLTLAQKRQVDLPPSAAELLADPREGNTIRNATMTAATLLALKLAWRKFFAVLAVGRRAEDMATTFQTATLFDHYCAKLHVGAGLDRPRAFRLRVAIHDAVAAAHKEALVSGFRDGARVLGRSLLEAPGWVGRRLGSLGEGFVRSGGNPDALPIDLPDSEERRWLDRAAETVEEKLGGLGQSYLEGLVRDFEHRYRRIEEEAVAGKSASC